MQTPLMHHFSNNSNYSLSNSSTNVVKNISNSDFMRTLTAIKDVNKTQEEGLIDFQDIPMEELLQSFLTELISLDLSNLNLMTDSESIAEEANIKMLEQWLEESNSKQSLLTVIALFNQLSHDVQERLSLEGNMTEKFAKPSLELLKLTVDTTNNQLQNLSDPLHNMQFKEHSTKFNLKDLFDLSPESLELINKVINDTEKKSSLQFIQLFKAISKTTNTNYDSTDVLTDKVLINILQKTLKAYQSNSSEFKSSLQNEQTSLGRLEQQMTLMNQILYQTNDIPNEEIQPPRNHNVVVHNDLARPTNLEVVKQPIEARNFTQEMSQFVFKTIRFSQFNGIAEARISLIPEQLGQVDVHMKLENGQLVTQFMADKLIGKEMIESQLPQLRIALQNLGIQVDKVEVVQMNSTSSSMLFQGETNQQFSQQYKQQDQNSNRYNNFLHDDLEIDMLNESLMNISGRGFDVTA
ncbi:flagellar hook-length control protein FliK [Chengkuizengella marina]|nr:flagellar hook-length control protein FliK [Chengkuizengella marina]